MGWAIVFVNIQITKQTMNNNKEFQELIDTINHFLPKIQKSFQKYQQNHFPIRSPQFFCLELNGEVGELANLEKKICKGKEVETSNLAEESADAFIALMNYSNSRDLDLTRALLKKLEWIENKRRELRLEDKEY